MEVEYVDGKYICKACGKSLREFVVIRKIIDTLRNTKGTEMIETIMTMITTWKQRGLDTFSMMKASI